MKKVMYQEAEWEITHFSVTSVETAGGMLSNNSEYDLGFEENYDAEDY